MAESPASVSLPKFRKPLERPAVRKKLEGMMLEGLSDTAIAAKLGVSRQAITAYRARHPQEIAAAVAEIERRLEDYHISQVVNRVADAQGDYDRLGAVIEARAADTRYDEPGYSTGLMTHQVKVMGTGRNQITVDEYKVDTALVAERRQIRREVGEVLDQLPRGTTIQDNRVQVLIRQVVGGSDSDLIPLS